jgi:hypothetical protein
MHSGIKAQLCLFTLFITVVGHAQQFTLEAKDGNKEDNFGYSASIDGNSILVGAPDADIKGAQDAGAGYVYVLGENGWRQQAKLIATPYFAGDTLGGNVALKNKFAVLGAIRRDDKGQDAGAAVIFERQLNKWQQKQILTAPDAKPGDAFGQSVALTDQYLLIGAPRSDALAKDSGAVYIYKFENDDWQLHTRLTASDGAKGDLFGISVAIDGNTVLVGADLNDEKAENAGAVYAFVLNDDKWTQEAKLMASDGDNTDIFGVRVSLDKNTALISARRDDVEGIGVDAGSAYIFERKEGNWTQSLKLISPDGKADDRFGRGVAISGNTAIVSAMNHDSDASNTGALYVYKKGLNGWHFTSKITAIESVANDKFGWNVDLSNDIAVIATPHRDGNGVDAGAVFVQDVTSIFE